VPRVNAINAEYDALIVGELITHALTQRVADLNKEMRAFMTTERRLGGPSKPSNTVDVGLAILKELRELNKNLTHLVDSYRAKVCTCSLPAHYLLITCSSHTLTLV
jgi:hypothetical protein